jgi:hypothetical protein
MPWAWGLAAVLVAGNLTLSDPPASAVNPQSGDIEIADPTWSGTSRDIDYVIDAGNGQWPEVYTVTDNPLDDHRPQLVIAPNGDAWVTWWRDDSTDRVLVRKRHFSDGSWDNERVLSDSGESSSGPTIAHDGTDAWVAYEFDDQSSTGIAVAITVDDPDPVGIRTVLATSEFSGAVDVAIHAAQGRLWTTWVDSATAVAWAEYDYASDTWGLPAFESYALDTVEDALDRIRSAVTP